MTLTLFDLTYRTARELGAVMEGTATGGTATTIIDTVNLTQAEHYWKGGTAWILYDAGGAGASPQGRYGSVTAFDSVTYTLTITSVTTAVAAGDRYAVAKSIYPLGALISAVNRALSEIRIPVVDTTTVDTAVNQSEYTLPIAANLDLRQVWIQNRLSDADDNQWSELHNWYVQRVATGSADLLVFPYQLTSGYDIKIVYASPHTELHAYSDKLADMVDYRRVVYRAAYYLTIDYQMNTGKEDAGIRDAIERFMKRADEADAYYRVPIPSKASRIVIAER